MFHLVLLQDHLEYSDTFALWLYQEFTYEFTTQPLVDWQQEFSTGQSNGDWQTLIALEDGQLMGGAALARDDLPERPELGPWLACVFVAPQARQRGLAEQLIAGVCSIAKAKGHERLYLHTHDRHGYYSKRGWEYVQTFDAWNKEHWLMQRNL
ncbi:GNAT family N-acetyltransferase (plasmid) [Pseudomonas luteola]|uniref:GNAT family N-acetyltransferase n=1 Tax=Pseudomonas TaxID=286 RepID=UPI003DA16014